MNNLSLIEGVKDMLKVWGAQKRYMLGLTHHEQGWTPQSSIARFRELRDAAGSRTEKLKQFMEEGHVGEGLLVARALYGSPIEINETAFVHSVCFGKAKQKAFALDISVAEYWRRVGNLQIWIAAKLPIVETVVETTLETRKAS